MAIGLDSTTKTLEITTNSSGSIDWTTSWNDATTSSFTPGDSQGNITTATTTVIVPAPALNTQRGVKSINIFNASTSSQTVTIKKDSGGTEYKLFVATLTANESISWNDGANWAVWDSNGKQKVSSPQVTGLTGKTIPFYKSGTAPEAAGNWYTYWKDAGAPGVWAPGTPGVNGRNTSGSASADGGCIPNLGATGSLFISKASVVANTVHSWMLADVLWVNTALVVTTTTGQAVSMAALPPRDINGDTSGEGCWLGIVSTAANTNAGVISNATVTYTNSRGVGSRTATMVNNSTGDAIPATPVIGTVVWFQLAAGDTGVASIQTVTLGTSLVTGTISMIIARPVLHMGNPTAHLMYTDKYPDPGIRIYSDSCLLWFIRASAASATSLFGDIVVVDR